MTLIGGTKSTITPYKIQSIEVLGANINFQVKPLVSAPLPHDNYGHQYGGNIVASHSVNFPGIQFDKIKVGQTVTVTMANGQTKQFKVTQRKFYRYNDKNHPELGVTEEGHKMSWNDMIKGVTHNPNAVVLQYSQSHFRTNPSSAAWSPYSIGANFIIAEPIP